jgi:hypothetical protein
MEPQERSDAERNADIVDVHILDVTAQIEALLRGIRDAQRNILKLRRARTSGERLDAAGAVQERLREMLRECDALHDAVGQAVDRAGDLAARIGEDPDGSGAPRRGT